MTVLTWYYAMLSNSYVLHIYIMTSQDVLCMPLSVGIHLEGWNGVIFGLCFKIIQWCLGGGVWMAWSTQVWGHVDHGCRGLWHYFRFCVSWVIFLLLKNKQTSLLVCFWSGLGKGPKEKNKQKIKFNLILKQSLVSPHRAVRFAVGIWNDVTTAPPQPACPSQHIWSGKQAETATAFWSMLPKAGRKHLPWGPRS